MRLAHDANPTIFTYYTMLKFDWTPRDVALALGGFGILMAFVFGFLPRLLVPRIGETMAVVIGLTIEAIAFTGYALSTTSLMMFGWMAVWTLSGLANPALSAIQSKLVPPNEQGELQGALASIGGLTSIVAPLLLTALFGYFTGPSAPIYFPGAAFLAAGAFAALALLLFAASQPRLRAAARPA
jgi:DHA1 family tetracycline resistance protein-like MFS transporter